MISKMEVLARNSLILTSSERGNHYLLHYLLHFHTTVPKWTAIHRRNRVDRMTNYRIRKRIVRATRSNEQHSVALRTRSSGNSLRPERVPWLTAHRPDSPIVLFYSHQGNLAPHVVSCLVNAGPRNWTSGSSQHFSRNCRAQSRPGSQRHP